MIPKAGDLLTDTRGRRHLVTDASSDGVTLSPLARTGEPLTLRDPVRLRAQDVSRFDLDSPEGPVADFHEKVRVHGEALGQLRVAERRFEERPLFGDYRGTPAHQRLEQAREAVWGAHLARLEAGPRKGDEIEYVDPQFGTTHRQTVKAQAHPHHTTYVVDTGCGSSPVPALWIRAIHRNDTEGNGA